MHALLLRRSLVKTHVRKPRAWRFTVVCALISCSTTNIRAQSAISSSHITLQRAVPVDGTYEQSNGSHACDRCEWMPRSSDFANSGLPPREQRAPWWSPVASFVVPGAGQIALGQQRSYAYLVAEGFLLLQAITAQRDGGRARVQYQSLAVDVARKQFGGKFPTGPWDYYESMEKFLESGAYDRNPGGAVEPEIDESTFNGARWLLARQTYWRDARVAPAASSDEYKRALAQYQAEAVRDDFRWSWRDAQLQQDVYRQTIANKNQSFQRATNLAGLVGANHLISMIDAYISVRLRRFGSTGAGVGGVAFNSVETSLRTVGDPAAGRRQLTTSIRLTTRAH